ncbi:MAG: hypothetical protein GX631_03310 [Dehalococcoidales bacterium]|jgi:hypothetical protein|nr:hypothetical protein [Dehalococcoidales bacterium]
MQEIKAKIPVILFKEGKNIIAYSPALDLSSCGPTEEAARERFAEAARLFLTETAKMGTLDEVMKECGWKKVPNKQGWQPPVYKSTEESVNIPSGV